MPVEKLEQELFQKAKTGEDLAGLKQWKEFNLESGNYFG